MQLTGNTILITGGGTGIGRALAEAFHQRGNQVIIAGRRQANLDEVTAANPGMRAYSLDIEDSAAIGAFAQQVISDFPALNAVIHNAGIMRLENVRDGSTDVAEATISTNLLGPIRLNSALIGHLLAQPKAAVLTVTSGIAFLPYAITPTYSATKAGLHAYTQTLRAQLEGTSVQVIELIPPLVQTELMGPEQASNPHALPLADYIGETMQILDGQPDVTEVIIERVKMHRYAEARSETEALMRQRNDSALEMVRQRGAPPFDR